MSLRQNETKRTVHAPAKLNLFLEVFGRRDDGFHELETLMVPIRWFDSLSFEPTPVMPGRPGEICFSLGGIDTESNAVPSDRTNLVVRAMDLLRRRSGCERGAKVELFKRIPSAAGLGGGSSDAAAALELANRAWGLDYRPEQLAEMAVELGSDVPFFLSHGAAICRGRGEVVEPLRNTVPLHVVIVKPPAALATREVYGKLDELSPRDSVRGEAGSQPRIGALSRALRQGDLFSVGRRMSNRLQAAADALSPWIGRVRTAFAALDFLGHQLSGSGAAYFGVCRHAQHAQRLATILRTRQLGLVFVTSSCR